MTLVYEYGPDVGQSLVTGDVDHPNKAIYIEWWGRTLALGRSVLRETYGNGGGGIGAAGGRFSRVLPSFPISELEQRVLFHQYGTEIGSALLLAALPQAYATSWGARVLAATGHLQNDQRGDLTRRIRATAQFLTFVLGPSGFVAEGDLSNGAIENAWDPWSPHKGQAFRSVIGLRLLHQVIRTILTNPPPKTAAAVEATLGPKNTAPCQPLNQKRTSWRRSFSSASRCSRCSGNSDCRGARKTKWRT